MTRNKHLLGVYACIEQYLNHNLDITNQSEIIEFVNQMHRSNPYKPKKSTIINRLKKLVNLGFLEKSGKATYKNLKKLNHYEYWFNKWLSIS